MDFNKEKGSKDIREMEIYIREEQDRTGLRWTNMRINALMVS
jgi:hypothetical protein